MADDSRFFDLEIITPDRVFWSGKASMLEMNTTEGQVGIYKKHIPMTMILQPGIVKLHLENEIKEAAIHAGFVEILPDKISMMAEVAEWPDEIDLNRAKEAAAARRAAAAGTRPEDQYVQSRTGAETGAGTAGAGREIK